VRRLKEGGALFKILKLKSAVPDPKTESNKGKEKRKRKAPVQPSTPKEKKSVTETIETVELRLNQWLTKNEYNGSFSITKLMESNSFIVSTASGN